MDFNNDQISELQGNPVLISWPNYLALGLTENAAKRALLMTGNNVAHAATWYASKWHQLII
jgi:hypothetical protein